MQRTFRWVCEVLQYIYIYKTIKKEDINEIQEIIDDNCSFLLTLFILKEPQHCDDDDDELMLNVLRCHLTY